MRRIAAKSQILRASMESDATASRTVTDMTRLPSIERITTNGKHTAVVRLADTPSVHPPFGRRRDNAFPRKPEEGL